MLPDYTSSANKQLYLISGMPTPKSDARFPSYLFGIDNAKKTLIAVREVDSEDKGTEFIRSYYDERIVIIGSLSGNTENNMSRFAIVNMDAPLSEKKIEITYPKSFYENESHLFNIANKGLYIGLEIAKSNLEPKLLGINLSTMKQEELPWDSYKYVEVSGIPGGAIPGEVVVANVGVNGQILIPSLAGKIESSWKLPPTIKFADNEKIGIFINNNFITALVFSAFREKQKSGLGYAPFYIFNKKTSTWHSVRFQGGRTGVRGFGIWLAGYVADEERDVDSPGKDNRRKEMTQTGTPVDWRFKDFRIYCPGILFLYNARTYQKFTIETGQGDSEVLLIEGDTVYYRVNDEIYMARIDKNKVEPATLLVKDAIVPDIHWAFMGPQ
jgi:hypothetical protein